MNALDSRRYRFALSGLVGLLAAFAFVPVAVAQQELRDLNKLAGWMRETAPKDADCFKQSNAVVCQTPAAPNSSVRYEFLGGSTMECGQCAQVTVRVPERAPNDEFQRVASTGISFISKFGFSAEELRRCVESGKDKPAEIVTKAYIVRCSTKSRLDYSQSLTVFANNRF